MIAVPVAVQEQQEKTNPNIAVVLASPVKELSNAEKRLIKIKEEDETYNIWSTSYKENYRKGKKTAPQVPAPLVVTPVPVAVVQQPLSQP